ncbi:MAG: hypothetical protein WBO73_03510 [Gammaproteobacteria bacterium]|jgi:hypothetical protein
MNYSKPNVLNAEDSLISKMTLYFLFTPLLLLMLAGAMIAM